MKISNNMKTALAGLLIVIVIAVFYFTYPWNSSSEFNPGNEVNYDTFREVLNDADTIYIVMDVRNVSSQQVKTNILQCGVDFAGSYGLVNKNVTYMSIDPVEKCIAGNVEGETGIYEINECLGMLNNGVSLYIIEGDGPTYHANAAMVGINESYALGTCAVGEATLSNY